MSQTTSHASTPAGRWQQQQQQQASSKNNSNSQNLATHRSSQSPAAGAKPLHNIAITSYPVNETGNFAEHSTGQYSDEHELQQGSSQLHNDYPSQYLSYGNYLTPDHGSENPFSEQSSYHSPSIDEFIWQENFGNAHGLDDFQNEGTLVNNFFTDLDQSGDLQGIVPKEISPTSTEPRSQTPRMSTITTTTTDTSQSSFITQQNNFSPHQYTGKMGIDSGKRSRTGDDEELSDSGRISRQTSNQPSLENASSVISQVVKPTVTISSYNRGDSPARTAMPIVRSLSQRSQRSQRSRLSDQGETLDMHDDGATEKAISASRLMPPAQYDNAEWEEDDDGNEADRRGVGPKSRNEDTIPSLNDMDKQRELDETRVGVENWLATSETGSPTRPDFDGSSFRNRVRKDRMRSRSTGARNDPLGGPAFSDRHIPGPGVLVDVDSDNDESEEGSASISSEDQAELVPETPPTDVKPVDPDSDQGYFPPVEDDSIAPDEQEPLPRQFYRRAPWQDPVRFEQPIGESGQPPTANQAIMQWRAAAQQFETASRAATWGTRRRLSDGEIASIIEGTQVRHLSLSHKARDRGNSFINRARTVIRRSSSNIKKSRDSITKLPSPPNEPEKTTVLDNDPNHTATSPIQQVQRTFSWGKPKSPPVTSTSGAFMAMTKNLAAVGGSTGGAGVESPHERPKSPFLSALKRSRSRSDVPKAAKAATGLSDMFNKMGGPPVPTLASPMQMRHTLPETNKPKPLGADGDEDMDDDGDDDVAVKMELSVQADNIIPNLDGFRTHARQLNPRLEQYLVERISQDQLRRYKKLVKNKIDHTRSVQLKQQCPSDSFCMDLGGRPKILPPRTSAKDANINYAQFKVGNNGESDGEETAFTEGVVTPALFPSGIPLPPTTHLPAEFECPLCFQVKKFQKPSDWTKHVHEDVQPFSCTFPNCPEPKSFKRKADWVRHENERHRHLEWWKCSIQECAHVCYRKDNFVQHLVREHKMTEPKSKSQRPAGNRARPAARSAQGIGYETDEFWHLVEKCRHDTTQTPRNEPCKFCGNVCSTWKKLSVHVGKHMEQIAMPVLQLAAKRAITAETVISPIDPPNQRMPQTSMLDVGLNGSNFDALSPYTNTVYQSSSAGQSPVPNHVNHGPASNHNQPFYDQAMVQNGIQQIPGNMQQYTNGNPVPPNYPYPSYEMSNGHEYAPIPHPTNAYTQPAVTQSIAAPYHSQQVPRSQPVDAGYGTLAVNTMQASMYNHDHFYPSSAPGHSYMNSYDSGIGHSDGLHSPHHMPAGHLHSPAASTQQSGGDYTYNHQPNTANGRSYY